MAIGTDGYPTGAVSSGTTAPASTTQQAVYQSLEAFNNATIGLYDTSSYANGARLLTTIKKLGTRESGEFGDVGITEEMTTTGQIFKWRERDRETDKFTINAVVAVGTAGANMSITVVSTAGMLAQQVLRNVTTNEQIRVVSVDSPTTFTATRKVGTIANAAMAVNQILVLLSTAVIRGASDLDTTAAPAVEKTGYMQKFIQTIKIDDFDMMSSKILDPKEFIVRMSSDKAYQLRLDQERAALFGQPYADPAGNYYTTEGIISFAQRGFSGDISGALTTRAIEEALSACTEYMSPNNMTKILLLGPKAKAAINALYTGRINRENIGDIKEQVETIEVGSGKFILMQHPLMNSDSGYDKIGVVIDPGYIKIMYPEGVDLEGKSFNGKARFEMNPTSTSSNMFGSFISYMGMKNVSANSAGIFKIST